MKEIIFNKKEYKSYKDMYIDIAQKTEIAKIEDYFDSSNLEYSPDILWECLECDFGYSQKSIKIILLNFDKEKIVLQKNYDDYEYSLIIEVFEDFVKKYPNNQLEFRMEEDEK